MAYTHFKIVELGARTNVLVNDIPVVLNTLYPKTDELKIEKQVSAHLGVPFDVVKYAVTDGTETSNTANIVVNCPPDLIGTPSSANETQTILNNAVYDVIDYIPFNTSVDRIKITGFNNVGDLNLNGFPIYTNLQIMHYDFSLIKFESFTGIGVGYQTIYYQVGNQNGFNPTIYSVRFDIVGLVDLIAISDEEDQEIGVETINYKEGSVEVKYGIPFGIAKVNLNVNLSASAWPVDTDNELSVIYNGIEYKTKNNIITDLLVTLNEFGVGNLEYVLSINEIDVPVTGTIDFELIDINGDPLLVSGTNTVSLTVNF
jgi:hypothetical protein